MQKLFYVIHKLLVGLMLRCPNCERGQMFHGLFRMDEKCPYCGARYERLSGESIGGTMINLVVAEMLCIGGWILSEILWHPPLAFSLIFWVSFNILFVVLFYRHARGIWVAVAYLTGSVYPDPDFQQEYSAPKPNGSEKR
jgi:uncharacterized protein (DUF983 family)